MILTLLWFWTIGAAWTAGVIRGWTAAAGQRPRLVRWIWCSAIWPWTMLQGHIRKYRDGR